MRITRLRDERKIYLSQKKYIERVLEHFNMKSAKPVNTPLAGHMKLSKCVLQLGRKKENMAKGELYHDNQSCRSVLHYLQLKLSILRVLKPARR
uniref:Reverse transcriptase Ty1/copia-type domain-containing protein n=1 Tax=Solanum lycopersicum TaxID=4081 RepID=A0A3Q7JCD4_SOLLC